MANINPVIPLINSVIPLINPAIPPINPVVPAPIVPPIPVVLPPPIGPFEAALIRANWNAANRLSLMVTNGVDSVETFEFVNGEKDMKELFVRVNRSASASIIPQKGLKAFRYWIHYKRARGQVPDPADFATTPEDLMKWTLQYEETVLDKDKARAPIALPEFQRDGNWDNWESSLRNTMSGYHSVLTNAPLTYLLRESEIPSDDDLSAHYTTIERDLVATTVFSGKQFVKDNGTLFQLLQQSVSGDQNHGRTHVEPFADERDGRKAYLSLKRMASHVGNDNERHQVAERSLRASKWDGSNSKFPFSAHISEMLGYHHTMATRGAPCSAANKVSILLDSIKPTATNKMDNIKTIIGTDSTLESNFERCVEMINKHIRVSVEVKPRSNQQEYRTIAATDQSGRGRSRGGRGGSGQPDAAPHGRLKNTHLPIKFSRYTDEQMTAIKQSDDFTFLMDWRKRNSHLNPNYKAPENKRKAAAVDTGRSGDFWLDESGNRHYDNVDPDPETFEDDPMGTEPEREEEDVKIAAVSCAESRQVSFVGEAKSEQPRSVHHDHLNLDQYKYGRYAYDLAQSRRNNSRYSQQRRSTTWGNYAEPAQTEPQNSGGGRMNQRVWHKPPDNGRQPWRANDRIPDHRQDNRYRSYGPSAGSSNEPTVMVATAYVESAPEPLPMALADGTPGSPMGHFPPVEYEEEATSVMGKTYDSDVDSPEVLLDDAQQIYNIYEMTQSDLESTPIKADEKKPHAQTKAANRAKARKEKQAAAAKPEKKLETRVTRSKKSIL